VIELRGLTVAFGRTVAVNDLTLDIDQGVCGVFGQNGSGKSTLLRCVAGLLRPARGLIAIDGDPVNLSDEAFRRQVGFAGHEPGLYRRLTVMENLRLFGSLYGVGATRIDEVVANLDLARFSDTRVEALSAGTRRRAAVARALLHEPRILLLDEPYANVDEDAAELISSAVRPWRSNGRVALIATHGAKKVKAFANAGLILRDGRSVMHGRYDRPDTADASR